MAYPSQPSFRLSMAYPSQPKFTPMFTPEELDRIVSVLNGGMVQLLPHPLSKTTKAIQNLEDTYGAVNRSKASANPFIILLPTRANPHPVGLEDRYDAGVFARDPESLPSSVLAFRALPPEITKAIPEDHVMLTNKCKPELEKMYVTKYEALGWDKHSGSGDKPDVAIDIVDLAGPDKYLKDEHPRNTERIIAIFSSTAGFAGTTCSLIHSAAAGGDNQVVKATLKTSLSANSIGIAASIVSIWLKGKCPKAARFMEAIGTIATVTGYLIMAETFLAY